MKCIIARPNPHLSFKERLNSLLSHKGFRKYFANTSWLFAERFLRLTLGLFVGVWVARYLGPERYGLLSYAQAFVDLFTAFASLGLDGILVRELVKYPEKEGELLGTTFGLKLIGAIFAILLVALAVNLTDSEPTTKLLVLIVSTSVIFQSFNVIDFYFQAKVQAKYSALANMGALFLSSLFKIYLILSDAPLIYFASAVVFDAIVLALGYVWWFVKTISFMDSKNPFDQLKFKYQLAVRLLSVSKFIIFSGIALMIQARIDQVMIKYFVGSKEVGYYSAALRLIELFGFIPMVLKLSLFPAIQGARNVSSFLYFDRLKNLYRLNFLLFLLVFIPIFALGDKIVVTLFGKTYEPAGVLLSLMSVRLFFTNMGAARSCYIISENLLKFSFITMVAGTLSNIILNLILIPDYGAKGAIIATIISFFITTFVIDALYPKTKPNFILQLKAILTFWKLSLRG